MATVNCTRPVSCVFLNKFEIAGFLSVYLQFAFFFHHVTVIFKKLEPLIKCFFASFLRFKRFYKMGVVILMCAKTH